MEQEITKLAMSQGLYAALFVALLFYVLRTTGEREMRAVEREEKLMSCLSDLSSIRVDVDAIKEDVGEMKQDLKILKDRGK